MPTPWQRCCGFIAGLILLPSVHANDLRLPALYSAHMVLQGGTDAPVWGWAGAGEAVRVRIAGREEATSADRAGKWQVTLHNLPAGGPFTLQVEAGSGRVSV